MTDFRVIPDAGAQLLRAATGTTPPRRPVEPTKARWWEWFQALAAVLVLGYVPGYAAYVAVRLTMFLALLATVLYVWQAADRDECGQVGRVGGYETRYEPVLKIFPGNCWVRFPAGETPEDGGWMPAEPFVMGGNG